MRDLAVIFSLVWVLAIAVIVWDKRPPDAVSVDRGDRLILPGAECSLAGLSSASGMRIESSRDNLVWCARLCVDTSILPVNGNLGE